jgi:putative ABC transport system permease protein
MLKNYLKIALRHFQKSKGYTVINVAGLSLGIAAATLIFLFARYELTYDHFHENAERTYLVYKERVTPAGTQATYDTWVPLLERMQADFPVVENGTRTFSEQQWIQHGGERFPETVEYVDPNFFEVFTFPLVRGDPANPLPHNNAVVLSYETARKYFGDADPVGQVLTIDHQVAYTVTGVLAEGPRNATIQPTLVVPITSAPDYDAFADEWGSSFLSTYVLLNETADAEALEAQFPAFVAAIWDDEVAARTQFKLLPLLDAYDTFTGSRQYAYILLAIALATILIACINFINLSTAQSAERAREIGMRKVLGAVRPQLVNQFLGESILMGFMSLVLGLALAQLLLAPFNDLYELALTFNILTDPILLGVTLVLGLALGLIAGFYPALFMSRFKPIQSLQGTFKTSRSGLRLRHTLVVVQFALSIVLIAGTGVMASQVS